MANQAAFSAADSAILIIILARVVACPSKVCFVLLF